MSCPKCAEGFVLPGEPVGQIDAEFMGAYRSPAPVGVGAHWGKRTIVLLSDGFGLPLKNCKILSDNLAKRLECDVWVPDYFNGRPLISIDNLWGPDRAGVKVSIMEWIKFIFTVGIPGIPTFISNRPSVVDKRVTYFINLLKEKKKYEQFGLVGYCFGGSTAIRFAGTDLVHSVVICHPGTFSLKEVNAMRVPNSWACPEEDIYSSRPARFEAEASLAARKDKENFVEYEFKDYKGTAHGFAARPNMKLPEIKEAHEKAFEQTVEWFKKTLP